MASSSVWAGIFHDDDEAPGPFALTYRVTSKPASDSDEGADRDPTTTGEPPTGESVYTGYTGTSTAYLAIDDEGILSLGPSDAAQLYPMPYAHGGGSMPLRTSSLDDILRHLDPMAGAHTVPTVLPAPRPTAGAATALELSPAAAPTAPTPAPGAAPLALPLPSAASGDGSIVDGALLALAGTVASFAHATHEAFVEQARSRRVEAGVDPVLGPTTFAPGEKVTQVFIGQLPACVTHDVLLAAIDNLLRIPSAPKLLSMRTPAPGSSQSGHALLTLEEKYHRQALTLNRRVYFTARAVYFATAPRDTAAFQRLVAKALTPLPVAATAATAAKLSRACIVVEPANMPAQRHAAAATAPQPAAQPSSAHPRARGPKAIAPPRAGGRQSNGTSNVAPSAPPPPPPPPYAYSASQPTQHTTFHAAGGAPLVVPGYFVFCPAMPPQPAVFTTPFQPSHAI